VLRITVVDAPPPSSASSRRHLPFVSGFGVGAEPPYATHLPLGQCRKMLYEGQPPNDRFGEVRGPEGSLTSLCPGVPLIKVTPSTTIHRGQFPSEYPDLTPI